MASLSEPAVVIVGAGIGGLAAGCYLQANGHRVTILEQGRSPGGVCTSWTRNGYVFDGCIHNLAGSGEQSPLHRVWRELGVVPSVPMHAYEELVQVERADGPPLTVHADLERLEEHLLALAPADARPIRELVAGARRFLRFDLLGLAAAGGLERALAIANAPALVRWGATTLAQFAGRFRDPFLRAALPTLVYDWPKQSMGMLLYFLAALHKRDLGWPIGGSLTLARAVERRFLELGGAIEYGARAATILVERDRAIGVRLVDGTERRAAWVVSNAYGPATIFEMLGGRYTSRAIRKYYGRPDDRVEMGIHVSLGVARDLSREPHAIVLPLATPATIANEPRERLYVQTFGFDPTLAPAGRSVLKVLLATSHEHWQTLAREPERYDAAKRETADGVIALLAQRFPGIAGQIETVDVATPVTTLRHTGNGRGFVTPPTRMLAALFTGRRLSQTLPKLGGFHMVGQWAGLPGVSMVAAMGRDVARAICRAGGRPFAARPDGLASTAPAAAAPPFGVDSPPMTIRNLDAVFRPRSVAVVGASTQAGSIGRMLMQNLIDAGFAGPIMPVNPKYAEVLGVRAWPSVGDLPEAPDLAVVAIPAAAVPDTVRELAERGTRAAVVISAGFGGEGRLLERTLLDAARPHLLRIVGPNTLGVIVPAIGLNASFAHATPRPGDLAFVAQSGAIATSVLDWALARGIGFSQLTALGDMADVDLGDMLDYLANDRATRAILLYVEAVTNPRKFMSAARAAARTKPVIVVKGGRHAQSAAAAASHTGRLAGSDAEYAAAFRRAGMLRVAALDELFAAVETLAVARPVAGRRLAIVTNGGGLGVLAADALLDRGGALAPLAGRTIDALSANLPAAWSHGNPVDIVGDATPERYATAMRVVLDDPNVDALLVLHCPTAVTAGIDVARAVATVVAERPHAAVFTSWLGEHTARTARAELDRRGVPTYETPERAVQAFMQLVDYRHNQELLLETPPSLPVQFVPDTAGARRVFDAARAERRDWLTGAESSTVLAAYGIAVATVVEAASPREAGEAAARLGGPVALKIASSSIVHKADVGGVALNLVGAPAVEAAADAMQARVRALRPEVAIRGFSVQSMVERADGLELIVGATAHGDFGPVVLFGEGGAAVEITADTAIELPPLNLRLARDLIARTRIARRMRGYRNVPPVDVDAVAVVLTRVSQLLVDFPEVVELDINPLLAKATGVIALDARIRTAAAAEHPPQLAIRPYPRELEQRVYLADGRELLLRPILPEDEPALRAAFARATPEEIRARFFVAMKDLPHLTAARFTQIDYDRDMAFVLCSPAVSGGTDIHAVVRLAADPDNRAAEFAIVVDRALGGLGLGTMLMRRLIDYARSRGIAFLWAYVLADNSTMRGLCRSLGFEEDQADGHEVRVELALDRYIPK